MKFNMKHLVVLLGMAAAPAAYSQELYSQAWDGTGNGWLSTTSDTAVYESFQVDPSSSDHIKVDSIDWVGSYTPNYGPVNPQFDIQVYDSTGSSLVAERIGQATETALPNGNALFTPNFSYSLDLSNDKLALYSGYYYLVIQAILPAVQGAWYWDTASSGLGASTIYSAYGSPTWLDTNVNFAFTLNGTVPEPETLLLLVPALIGLGFSRKSQKA